MDDETLIDGVNGSSQEPLAETNGSESQPDAGQQTPPPQEYLSRQDLERWQADIDAKWQARLQEVERKAQAKADKARDTAIRKAKDFDAYAASMKAAGIELDPEQIANVKSTIVNQQFWSEDEQPQAGLPPAANPQSVNSEIVSRDELINYVRAQGLSENDVDLTKYVGASRYDSQTEQDFLDDVAIARAKAAEAKRQAKINKQQAQVAGQVKQEFGTLSSPATGAPKAGYDPVAELEKMNKQDPPSDPAAYRKWMNRQQQLYAEASKRVGN